jgi:predicted GIY-YIG superfamily endonuclease
MPKRLISNKRYLVYCLESKSSNLTYVGSTNDRHRRLMQHNGLKAGGSKYTANKTARPWHLGFYVKGFKNHRQALQFEYSVKHESRKFRSCTPHERRLKGLGATINKTKWTCNSSDSTKIPLRIHFKTDRMTPSDFSEFKLDHIKYNIDWEHVSS